MTTPSGLRLLDTNVVIPLSAAVPSVARSTRDFSFVAAPRGRWCP